MNKIAIRLLIIFYSVLSSSLLIAQTPPYYHYTSSEGLASSQVYDLIQDKSGYIWFATANGVSRFDGHKFENFTTTDGLISNSIITLIEGQDGHIYFGNEFAGFNVYANGKIKNYSNQTVRNPVIIGMIYGSDALFSYYIHNISSVDPENTVNIFNKSLPPDLVINNMIRLNDSIILAATKTGICKFEDKQLIKMNIKGLDEQEIFYVCGDKDNNITLGARGKIYEVRKDTVFNTMDVDLLENNYVRRLLKDSKGNIWFSNKLKGFYFINHRTNEIENIGVKVGLENKIVNNFMEDNEGNIWVSTYGEGVLCLNNLYLKSYSQKDGLSNNKVTTIAKDNSDRIFAGTLDGLNVLFKERFNRIIGKNSIVSDNEVIYEIMCFNDSVYTCASVKTFTPGVLKSSFENDRIFSFGYSSLCLTKDNKLITGSWANTIQLHTFPDLSANNQIPLFHDSTFSNKVYCIYEDSRNNLWIGTASGLCKMSNGVKTFFTENEILSSTVKKITEGKSNNVWFACDKGIASYRLSDSLITNYSGIDDHNLTSSNTLVVDKFNRIWIGGMNGLIVLDREDDYKTNILNTETGLPSNEIFSLYYDTLKNVMWIGSAKGISRFDIPEYENQRKLQSNVLVTKVKGGDSLYENIDNLRFEPDVENIHIDFTAINFSSPSSVNYQYKLDGDWVDISSNYLNLTSLKKGNYDLSIRGKSINSDWGNPSTVSFTVLPKFTETLLFQFSLLGLLFLGVAAGVTKRNQIIKKRNKEKIEMNNQVNDLKHKALSSMMNPHFIFNSLNSVQHLVNIDRKKEANDYISLMAKLIRMNLETASESYIRLDEEIKRLDLYLRIEKLRFSDKFQYEIITGKDIDPDTIWIPNMIIQPFVENSIWHGIMPAGREGFVQLSFNFEMINVEEQSFRFFVIRIIDNGIGFSESQKNRKDGHISHGINIIKERLVLLSKDRKIPLPIFEDLNSKNKDRLGAEVVLSIPPELYLVKKPQ